MDPAGQEATAREAAFGILEAFDDFQREFKSITRRARRRFEQRDWQAMQRDALERLELYGKVVGQTVSRMQAILADSVKDTHLWSQMNDRYAVLIAGREDLELAETFFNSITRRIFSTVGVDPQIEFIDTDFELPSDEGSPPIYHAYLPSSPQALICTRETVQAILGDFPFDAHYQHPECDAQQAARLITQHFQAAWGTDACSRIDILKPIFYRSNGAFLVGRVWRPEGIHQGPRLLPLVLCLRHPPGGILLDAVLLDEDDVSIVFSFTRSYFHVEVERTHGLVTFLKSIMPLKRIAELYISIGYNKHGKTELYRDLIRHLRHSTDRFEIARGERGMVMVVFSMPSYDVVFKVIRDRADPPKTTTRREVIERYDLVFRHDRAGRLVDAQEFEHLSFERERFSDALIQELLATAPSQVTVSEECVSIKHLYTERRMTPLNLYVQEASEEAAHWAVVDYGRAIKDLAATNIFPGDILLKNFGVTRHGRVVFYDYDELCLLTECKFRRMPQPSSLDEEYASEPWFYVGPLDIFPEEFHTFLGLQGPLRSLFSEHHADLFGVDFWRRMQQRHRAGEVIDVAPYPDERRLAWLQPCS